MTTTTTALQKKQTKNDSLSNNMDVDTEISNPWAAMDNNTASGAATAAISSTEASNPTSHDNDTNNRTLLARSLVPLLWSAVQTHQPKASRVAAARWASTLLKIAAARWASTLLKKHELDVV
jgi:hypothetical protein